MKILVIGLFIITAIALVCFLLICSKYFFIYSLKSIYKEVNHFSQRSVHQLVIKANQLRKSWIKKVKSFKSKKTSRQLKKEPLFQTIGFEARELPIRSLKNPIPVNIKSKI
jgi:hypothetical protein